MLIREMKLGDSASVTKTVTETDVYLFAGITGDLNPAHTNEVSASQTQFGGRIAHGILGAGFISAVLGMKLPGPGTIYLGQELKFTKPVYIGDTVTATCTVQELFPEKNIVKLDTVRVFPCPSVPPGPAPPVSPCPALVSAHVHLQGTQIP